VQRAVHSIEMAKLMDRAVEQLKDCKEDWENAISKVVQLEMRFVLIPRHANNITTLTLAKVTQIS